MKAMITKGIAGFSIGLMLALSKDSFNEQQKGLRQEVSYSWLVRTGHLFNGASRWLKDRKGIEYSSLNIQEDFLNSGYVSKQPFSRMNGRLVSASKLNFLKTRFQGLSDHDLSLLYSDLTVMLREWDDWYLDTIASMARQATDDALFMNRSKLSIIFEDTPMYKFGTDPKLLFDTVQGEFANRVVVIDKMKHNSRFASAGPSNDEEFTWFTRQKDEEITADRSIPSNATSMFERGHRPTEDELFAFGDAVYNQQATPSSPSILEDSPLTAAKLQSLSASQKAEIVIVNARKTPILDWLREAWKVDDEQ